MEGNNLKNGKNKYFIITIDTEGDNIWHRVTTPHGMREIAVENAKYIERFQLLCEKYHFIPTYLVNYEMAHAEPFVSLAREWVKEGKCEIGMHMHAWNTPPIYNLPFNRKGHNPFAGEYPRKVLWKKLCVMTETLEKQFGVRPTSHRGGRWYIDGWYIKALKKLGYEVDCTVTPGVDWSGTIGNEMYGQNYMKHPMKVYSMKGIWEVPPTIVGRSVKDTFFRMIQESSKIKKISKEKIWLRPTGKNLKDMLYLLECTQKQEYIEFMLHSSELMPGGSPNFKTKQSIEELYRDLEILFSEVAKTRKGISITEFALNCER